MAADNQETFEHFRIHGWMRVRAAFSVEEAAAMRAAAWRALARIGISQSDPSTWTTERPEHLQHVKDDPAFRAVGSARLLEAIDAALEGQAYETPKNWGALFLAFPSHQAWTVLSRGWHSDANYVSALSPPAGVRTHALFGDVAPRAGGTLIVSGSHRLVHKYFRDNPPPLGARGADYRRLLQGHPYLRDLHSEGDADERAARFMDRAEEHAGIPLQVVENTGRFLLSGGVDLPSMWPASGE